MLHSPGGSLDACYRIARILATYTNDWTALVPSQAASGATLISLGSSEIVLSDIAQLSPIDPQVISKRHEKFFAFERQSPLEAFQAVKYLREFALTTMDATMDFLLDHGVSPHLALETATKFAAQVSEPILAKIEPYDLGSFALDSNLAAEYCRRICRPEDSLKKAQRNVDYRGLVENYPAHEFIIDPAEATALGFCVSAPDRGLEEAFTAFRELEVHACIGLVSIEDGDAP